MATKKKAAKKGKKGLKKAKKLEATKPLTKESSIELSSFSFGATSSS